MVGSNNVANQRPSNSDTIMEASASPSITPDLLVPSSISKAQFTADQFTEEQMTNFQKHFEEG